VGAFDRNGWDRRPGPRSVTWRVNRARAAVLAWPRAILMQIAHPLIGSAIARHSTFQCTPLSPALRLHATVRAMLRMTFGTPESARDAVARIRRIHDGVYGTIGSDAGRYRAGTDYSAHDPQLLTWVLVTLLDSVPLAYADLIAPLSEDERDTYCAESRSGVAPLGIPPGMVPTTSAEVRRRISAALGDGTLALTDETRALGRSLLSGPLMTMLEPATRVTRRLTIGWLPPELRSAYGFEWSSRDAASFERWCRLIRRVHAAAPERLTTWGIARRAEARQIDVVNLHP